MDPFWSDGWFWGAAGLAIAMLFGLQQYLKSRRDEERENRREDREELARKAKAPPIKGPPPKPRWPEIVSTGVSLDRHVVGRDEDVKALRRKLTDRSAAAMVPGAVVKGQGGMGKTTLARFYIQRCREKYRGIWWLRAQQRDTLIADLCDLGTVLGVQDSGAGREALARATVVRLVSEPGPWLLVYDNAEGASEIGRWRPAGGDCHLIVTSREGHWPAQYAVQGADRLEHRDAVDLLMQESGRTDDGEGALRLAEELAGLPLALVNAGAWLRDTRGISFDSYRERVEELLAYKPETVEDYPDSVYGAVKLSLDRLGREAALLMKVFAFLAPDDLWAGLVTGIPKADVPNHRSSGKTFQPN